MSVKSFGALLREHRVTAGLSQEALAERSGVSVEAIGALEREVRRAPYRETVDLLANALGIAPEERETLKQTASRARTRSARTPAKLPSTLIRRLPLQSTSFIGRADDIRAITDLIDGNRLVTVTGSGGIGKTRTVIEVAAQLPTDRWERIQFVDLSNHTDGKFIANAIVPGLDPVLTGGAASVTSIVSALMGIRALIILDNCEHLLAEVSAIVTAVLSACEHVSFLATSRERLAIYGEVIYRLPSLGVPAQLSTGIAKARESAAVELFVQRAATFDQTVSFTDAESADVIAICRRLEGIPLAIELASARVSALGIRALRDRLEKGLITSAGARDLPLRQQTILATVAWSYELLSEVERKLLNRLSIFVGGFTLAAAESVCAADGIEEAGVADVLASLFDKSLVNATSKAVDRFRLLDSVRSFAAARLAEEGSTQTLARRHAEWLADFAERIDMERVTMTAEQLWSVTSPELENARAALQWALESGSAEGPILASRIVGGLRTVWLTSGRRAECRRWATRALDCVDEARDPRIAARLLKALIQSTRGKEMYGFVKRAIQVFERIGDRSGLALLHIHLAHEYNVSGRLEEAEAALARSAELLSGFESAWPAPYTTFLMERFQVNLLQGRFALARIDIEKGMEIDASMGDRRLTRWRVLHARLDFLTGHESEAIAAVAALAEISDQEGRNVKALGWYFELAALQTASGDLEGGYATFCEAIRRAPLSDQSQVRELAGEWSLLVVALDASSRGESRRAAILLGAIDFLRGCEPTMQTEQPGFGIHVILRRRLIGELQSQLTSGEMHVAWLEGYRLPADALFSQLVKI